MIEKGTQVKVHYTGTLADGSTFDSSEGRDPLEFKVGEGMVIPGFDTAVMGMEVGATASVTIPADEAYGQVNDELVLTVERDRLPAEIAPEEGMVLRMETPNGAIPVRVVDVGETEVKLDANHPLAGEDLTFELTLVEAAAE